MFEQSVALISWILVSLNLSNSFFFFFFFKSATLFSIGGISWFSVDLFKINYLLEPQIYSTIPHIKKKNHYDDI